MASSVFDRYKKYDISLLTCSDKTCYINITTAVKNFAVSKKLEHYWYDIKTGSEINDIENVSRNSVATIAAVCRHNEQQMEKICPSLSRKSNVIACSTTAIKSVKLKTVKSSIVDSEKTMENFLSRVHSILKSDPLYDDGKVSNDYESDMYPDGSGASVPSYVPTLRLPSPEYPGDTKECLAPVGTPNTYLELKSGNENVYCKLPYTDKGQQPSQHCSYLNVETLLAEQESRGAFVLDSFLSTTMEEKVSSDFLVSQYNRGDDKIREELSRFLVTKVLRQYLRHRNATGLVTLLKCDNKRIQANIFDCLEKLLYNTEARQCNARDIGQGADVLISLMRSARGDPETVLKISHILSVMLAVLYLFTIRSDEAAELEIGKLCESISNCCTELKDVRNNDVLKYALKSLKLLAVSLQPHQGSRLQIGNWKDALRIKATRDRILNEFLSYSDIEMFASVFGVVNQILQKHHTGFEQLVDLLRELLSKLIKSKLKKSKSERALFQHLIVVTKALVMLLTQSDRLEQGSDGDDTTLTDKIMKILSHYLENPKINQLVRKHLIMEIEPLLLHRNKFIVERTIDILSRNNQRSSHIRCSVLHNVDRSLTPLNLDIDHYAHVDTVLRESSASSSPTWCSVPATISNNRHVTLHILLPSLQCLRQGAMKDNKGGADRKLTEHHINNMDILHQLNRSERHNSIINMIAYQCRPLPTFYLTERFIEDNLQKFLLRRRKKSCWIPQITLGTICANIIDAVNFIHSKGIIHRDLTAESFSIREEESVVLSDFSIAKQCQGTFITDLKVDRIPLRWSAPESILADQYSVMSDTYMLGMLIVQIYTHGCHPFTELYRYSLESVLELIIFRDLKPLQWPCIPKDVQYLISSFVETDPNKRSPLQTGVQRLNDHLASLSTKRARHLQDVFREDSRYPKMDTNLPEGPERELPATIKGLKVSGLSAKQSYINLRKSKRIPQTVLGISEADLVSPNDPIVQVQNHLLEVKEPVKGEFIESTLPQLLSSGGDFKDILNIATWPLEIVQEGKNVSLKYKCHEAENILNIACENRLGDPENCKSNLKYLQTVYPLIQYVEKLHSMNWIVRDMCVNNIFLYDRKVFCPRISRLAQLQPDTLSDDCIIDEVFTERRNWFPIETLRNGQYSKEGDVYMLAMAIYQFYMALEIYRNNPVASKLKCVPFCKVPKKKLLEHLSEGEVPDRPQYCPEWLYDLLVQCWNRDRTHRPTAKEVKNIFVKRIGYLVEPLGNTLDHDVPALCPGPDSTLSSSNSDSSNYPQTESESLSDASETKFSLRGAKPETRTALQTSSFQRNSRNRSVLKSKHAPVRQQLPRGDNRLESVCKFRTKGVKNGDVRDCISELSEEFSFVNSSSSDESESTISGSSVNISSSSFKYENSDTDISCENSTIPPSPCTFSCANSSVSGSTFSDYLNPIETDDDAMIDPLPGEFKVIEIENDDWDEATYNDSEIVGN